MPALLTIPWTPASVPASRASVPASILLTIILACTSKPAPIPTLAGGSATAPQLTLATENWGDSTVLTLTPSPGARINARLKPALELPDGRVLRFDSPALDADSSYFTAPPVLRMAGPASGLVRASVCGAGEEVCRMVTVAVGR